MSSFARTLSVTMGTYHCMNGFGEKGYAHRKKRRRQTSGADFLTDKGRKANAHHKKFHEGMIQAVKDLDESQQEVL